MKKVKIFYDNNKGNVTIINEAKPFEFDESQSFKYNDVVVILGATFGKLYVAPSVDGVSYIGMVDGVAISSELALEIAEIYL